MGQGMNGKQNVHNRRNEEMRGKGRSMAIPYSRTIFGQLPWYSVLVVAGITLAIWLASCEEKRKHLPKDTIVDLALWVIPLGIAGARLYYVAMSWKHFASQPLSVLYLWEGGLAIYGGVIGGALGVYLYSKRKKQSFAVLADAIAPGLLLAQAIGRWGNYFNMEAYGPAITEPLLQFFPFGVLIRQGSSYVWHMATFFYESMWNLAGFCVLWTLRKRPAKDGSLFCWYLLIYGSGRFIIEQLRTDSLYLGPFRASQWLSLGLCIAASAILLQRAAGRGRRFVPGMICAALWIARWAFLEFPVVYGALVVLAGIMAVWLMRNHKALGLLVIMLALDAIGLIVGMSEMLLAEGIHALLCSVTLPGMMLALCNVQE